jgi:hypothetical protein
MVHTACAVAMSACSSGEPSYGVVTQAATVGDYVYDTCSTSMVIALSRQVAEEVDCLMPGQLVPFEEIHGIVFNGGAILPYLDQEAVDDLYAAAIAGGRPLRVNSAFRSVVQQYLLRAWFEQGRCGITAAALPGQSNHESGRALDIDNWSEWIGDLADHGWDHTVPGDDVHFDHLSSPDIRGADVLAFQRLWNRNHPGDVIDEDGEYGPMTASKIASAPAEGFAIGATCVDAPAHAVDIVTITGPQTIAPGERATFTIEITNIGTATWSVDTAMITASGAPSAFHDAETWISPSEVIAIGHAIDPGHGAELVIEIVGPQVTEPTPMTERFAFRDGDEVFGTIPLDVVVDPADVVDPPPGEDTGGCASGGSGTGSGALVVLLALGMRRRRA